MIDLPRATLSITQNDHLNKHKREAVQEQLRLHGLPAVMDGTHVVCSGIDLLCQWIIMSFDGDMASVLGGPYHAKAMEGFVAQCTTPYAVEMVASPGLSFRGSGRAWLDGVCLKIRFVANNANEGPMAYVVPVTRFYDGMEWADQVALVPKSHLGSWMNMMTAAQEAQRVVNTSGLVLRSWNGPDEHIQPMALDDIIMDDAIKGSFVNDLRGFLSRRDWYTERRLTWCRKFLLNGPPGTGKTSLARWAATELGMPTFTVDFADQYLSSRSFKRFLNYVKYNAPALVIFDDLEKIMGGQNRSGVTSHTLLTSLSGMGSLSGIVIVATSNSKKSFRGPMKRRFDAIIEVPLPQRSHRSEYLTKMLAMDEVGEEAIQRVAMDTDDWSFDDLRAAVTAAANSVIARGGSLITSGDLKSGVNLISQRRTDEEE